jgi:hypothetical protein
MNTMNTLACTVALTLGTLCVAAALAQAPPAKPLSTSLGLVVFPAKGQAASQQAADEGECFAWSKGQTGVDPMAAPPPAPAAAPPPATGPAADGSRTLGAGKSGSSWGLWLSLGRPIGNGSILESGLLQ